jgi:hypothetical protein
MLSGDRRRASTCDPPRIPTGSSIKKPQAPLPEACARMSRSSTMVMIFVAMCLGFASLPANMLLRIFLNIYSKEHFYIQRDYLST